MYSTFPITNPMLLLYNKCREKEILFFTSFQSEKTNTSWAYNCGAKLAELTGIPAAQLGRYANDKAKPRPAQRRKIVEALHRFAVAFSSIVP